MQRIFVSRGSQGGKSLALAQTAVNRMLEDGKPVAVFSEDTKNRILEEAARRGVQIPEPVVIKPNEKTERGVTFAGIIVDQQI